MFNISILNTYDIKSDILANFQHNQVITKKHIKSDNKWDIIDTYELREWDEEKRLWLADYLRQQIQRGGAVIGAYDGELLIGFCSVDGYLYGSTAKYANLTMLFVDDRFQRKGIGKSLFTEICKHAAKIGAEKLFISAIPSVETIAFYFNLGCTDANEIITEYIDSENDRYLEYIL